MVSPSRRSRIHWNIRPGDIARLVACEPDCAVRHIDRLAQAVEHVFRANPAFALIDRMVDEFKRPGRAGGGGFYDYPADGEKFLWPELKRLCLAHKLTDNDIPDAWIAAAIKTAGGHLITFDKGFRRFLSRNEFTLLEF